jgi:HK97 family phage portal protein
VPHILDAGAADKLRADWDKKFRGSENAHKLAIFDGGMEWVQTGMSNTDAQYLEARKFQNQQIYSLYRMPPHKVGELERSTNNNIEHQALEYVTDCLMTELTRWEQTLWRDLLTAEEQKVYFFEFLTNALLRGDFASRMAGYAIARNWGIYSADDSAILRT